VDANKAMFRMVTNLESFGVDVLEVRQQMVSRS
jgi:hypothetical protein